ncbi:Plant organelle RNA recognition domain containing protein, partial [Parasponia andersonii]
LIFANPRNTILSLQFLSKLSQKLHLNHIVAFFLHKYPPIFHLFYDLTKSQPFSRLADVALHIARQEFAAIVASMPLLVDRLGQLLAIWTSKTMLLQAIFKDCFHGEALPSSN